MFPVPPQVDTPQGREVLPRGGAVVDRAIQEDLDRPVRYQVAFIRNSDGRVVYDRR